MQVYLVLGFFSHTLLLGSAHLLIWRVRYLKNNPDPQKKPSQNGSKFRNQIKLHYFTQEGIVKGCMSFELLKKQRNLIILMLSLIYEILSKVRITLWAWENRQNIARIQNKFTLSYISKEEKGAATQLNNEELDIIVCLKSVVFSWEGKTQRWVSSPTSAGLQNCLCCHFVYFLFFLKKKSVCVCVWDAWYRKLVNRCNICTPWKNNVFCWTEHSFTEALLLGILT